MIEVYKMLSDHCGYDKSVTELLRLSTNTHTQGHPLKLEQRRARLDSRKFSSPFRVVKVWNSLPEGVVLVPSLTAFKQRLDRHWHPSQAIKWDYTASQTGTTCI